MGGCALKCAPSKEDREALSRSRAIEKTLREDTTNKAKEVKLLLLGAGGSGKSTVAKQMRILNQDGFSSEKRMEFKRIVYDNVVEFIRTICNQMETLDISFEDEDRVDDYSRFLTFCDDPEAHVSELNTVIKDIWNDSGVQECFTRAREYDLEASAEYYVNELDRVLAPDYHPSIDDVLLSRVATTGIIETQFTVNDLHFKMYDVGGQRSERKKWFHCFEGVTAIIFVVAMSEYDLMLQEDRTVKRMHESMNVFHSINSSKWFMETSIILFLNKKDLFEIKIKTVPLTVCFPDYEGINSYEDASSYILEKFKSLNCSSDKEIYCHFTCATDTKNIQVVFNAVTDVIIKNNLKHVGLF